MPKNSKPSCLNDYRSVALTSTVMKVFERLLKKHICSSIPATLDPLQFAYRPNRSTDDAISQVLHSSLTHIDSKNGNYVRLLFIDYSSAFNTIVPTKLAVKLSDLGLNTSLCDWIQDFLTARPQVVKVGQFTSNSITLNVGAPQGCVLSPLLYSLYTHDCVSSHSSTSIIKFADDTVVLGLINNDDEATYLWRFSTAWYGTVRFGTVHFWGVFHWVLYMVPDTFLVPLRSRFHASRTVTKTWRVNSADHWLAGENRHYCVTELATRDPPLQPHPLDLNQHRQRRIGRNFVWTNAHFCINHKIAVSLSVEEVQTFLSLIAEERIQWELDGATTKEKALCI